MIKDQKYTVLWVDDEWENLIGIRQKAVENNIELIGYSNAEAAILELKKNYLIYDAVILDGLFYLSKEEKGVPTKQSGLMSVATTIQDLKNLKVIPWFILTGKSSVKSDSTSYLESQNKLDYIFDKLEPTDIDRLFEMLKKEADNQPITQLRHKYHDALRICDEDCLGRGYEGKLLEIIQSLEEPSNNYNELRQFYEHLFKRLSEIEILPKELIGEKGWISNSAKILAGINPSGYEVLLPDFIHPLIGEILRNSLFIMQDGSHVEGNLKLDVKGFTSKYNTGYVYRSVVYGFLEVIAYMAKIIKENPDPDLNSKRYKKIEDETYVEGIIACDANGNYHAGDILLNYKAIHNSYSIGAKIKIIDAVENTNTSSKSKYPKFGFKFVIIE